MTGAWLVVAGALATLVAAIAVQSFLLRGVPLRRRLINALLPASQLAMAAFAFFQIVVFQLPVWLLALVAGTCAVCALSDAVLFRTLRKAEKADEAAERARLLEEQVKLQQAHRGRLESDIRQARHAREQLAEELARVDALLVGSELAQVPGQLERAARVLDEGEGRFCGHRVVDALMFAKARACAEGDVRLECALEVPDDSELPDVELCALFSNVMDNALQACAAVPVGERFIRLHARTRGGFFLIDACNACAEEEPDPLPALPARRRADLAEHGWGLSIMQGIANRHAGTLVIEREGGVFRTSLALELSKA